MDKNSLESTNRLLRVVIALLVRRDGEQSLTVKQQVDALAKLGMGASEIAATLGRTPTHISKELAAIRKATGRKKQ